MPKDQDNVALRAIAAVTVPALDVDAMLDRSRFGLVQLRVIGFCILVTAVEGFDAQAIGYVAPSLIRAWHLRGGSLGPVFSIGLVGLMLGALFIAPLADRVGRRPVLLASLIIFGTSSLATAFVEDLKMLMVMRFITGVGLGGAMPNALALTAEYMPHRWRGLLIVVMFNGFNIGSMLGGILSAKVVDTVGWQTVFVVGGALPLLVVPAFALWVPESLAYLVSINAPRERIERLLKGIDKHLSVDLGAGVVSSRATERHGFRELFTPVHRRTTALLWLIFLMSLLDIYLLTSWLPTVLSEAGMPIRSAIAAGIVLQLGSVIGCIPIGWAFNRWGPRAALAPAYVLGGICIAGIGASASHLSLMLGITFFAGFGLIGAQAAANALSAISYPTTIRSTGIGWALGVGRVGSIVGPLIGGALVSAQVPVRMLLILSAGPALIASVAVFGLPAFKSPSTPSSH